MAEAFLRHDAGDRFEAFSAGTEPGTVHPLTVQVMAEQGIDIGGQYAKPIDAFLQARFDYVITVCDDANEACPVFPNARYRLHWGFPDPSRDEGTSEQRLATFRSVRDAIRARVDEFLTASVREGDRPR
jgi:arsenate reductase